MLRKLLFRSSILSFKRILPKTQFKAHKLFFSTDNKKNDKVNDSNDETNKNDNNKKKKDDSEELNLENENENTIISNDLKKSKNDFQIKDEIKLETVQLRSRKFSLTEEEKLLPQKTYVFFSSGQSIISKSSQKVGFDIGKNSLENLTKEFAFFLHGESTEEIYRVGVVLDKSVNKEIRKEFLKKEESKSQQTVFSTKIKLKEDNFRVKIAEIQMNDDGIIVKCIPYLDNESPIENYPIKNDIAKIYSYISTIKSSLGYDKINSFEDYSTKKDDLKHLTPEKIDSTIYKIICDIEKVNKFLKEPLSLTSQIVIESRSIVTRVLFIKKQLEKICDGLDIVNRNFKIVEENIRRQEIMNRAKMCLDYIRFSSSMSKEGKEEMSGTIFSQNQTQPKKYLDKIHLITDDISREKVRKEIERFHSLDKYAGEYHKMATYLDEIFAIPWTQYTEPIWDVDYTTEVLEQNIYGLEKVKERIVEMVAVNKLKKSDKFAKGFIILLEGPPGTGKTSIAKHIATSLQRNSRLISFSGVSDSHFIKGHRRTYVDSQPGVFIKEIIKAGCMNPVFILDEIDKMSQTRQGADPYTSLLEILNPEENMNFVDHYLDIKVDFSNVIFILTANDVRHILEPLKNRLEIINIDGYIEEEKLEIAHKYVLPQVYKECGINSDLIKFNNEALTKIIQGWCYHESGVRMLRRCLEKICRKHVAEIMGKMPDENVPEEETKENNNTSKNIKQEEIDSAEKSNPINKEEIKSSPIVDMTNTIQLSNDPKIELKENIKSQEQKFEIQTNNKPSSLQSDFQSLASRLHFNSDSSLTFSLLRRFLGPPTRDSHLEARSQKLFMPGIVNILSVSHHVGNVLKVECIFDKTKGDKKGEFNWTGNLKTVTKESLIIAKINAYRFLSKEQIDKMNEKNVHIHFMNGSSPKDGPSAGISFCTAFLSLTLGKSVPATWSMTGELSLNGDVSKIGGVNSKIIASKSLNINVIILPYLNLEEVLDLPRKLLDGITLYFVKEYKEIFRLVFENDPYGICVIKNGDLKIEGDQRSSSNQISNN